jgi:hypothetical protein
MAAGDSKNMTVREQEIYKDLAQTMRLLPRTISALKYDITASAGVPRAMAWFVADQLRSRAEDLDILVVMPKAHHADAFCEYVTGLLRQSGGGVVDATKRTIVSVGFVGMDFVVLRSMIVASREEILPSELRCPKLALFLSMTLKQAVAYMNNDGGGGKCTTAIAVHAVTSKTNSTTV